MKEIADEVWERSNIDGNYTLVKMRHTNHVQWNPGTVKTEAEMEKHLTVSNAKYPVTEQDAYTKSQGAPRKSNTLTRTDLRELLREVYQQGQTDAARSIQHWWSVDELDELINQRRLKTTEK
jgi:hypothetical protein